MNQISAEPCPYKVDGLANAKTRAHETGKMNLRVARLLCLSPDQERGRQRPPGNVADLQTHEAAQEDRPRQSQEAPAQVPAGHPPVSSGRLRPRLPDWARGRPVRGTPAGPRPCLSTCRARSWWAPGRWLWREKSKSRWGRPVLLTTPHHVAPGSGANCAQRSPEDRHLKVGWRSSDEGGLGRTACRWHQGREMA